MDAARVWAARLGSPDEGTRGSLALEPGGLVFAAEEGGIEIRVPIDQIRHVRRVHGSPVMVVEHGTTVVAFYFAQPPPLPDARGFMGRRRRAGTLTYLGDTNTSKRREIKQWVRAIRQAMRETRRES